MKPKKSGTSNTLTLTEFKKAMAAIAERFDSIESRMATKDDLKNFATKDDLKKIWDTMATKENFVSLTNKLLDHDGIFEYFKKTFSTREQVDSLKNQMDSFAQKSEVISRKDDFHDNRLRDAEEKLSKHEDRITALEKSA